MHKPRRTIRCRVESLDIDRGLIPGPTEREAYELPTEVPERRRIIPPPSEARARPFRMEPLAASNAIRPLLREIRNTPELSMRHVRMWIGNADERVHLEVLKEHRWAVDPAPWESAWLRDLLVAQAFAAAHEEGLLWTPLLERLVVQRPDAKWLRPWARQLVGLRRWIRGTTDVAALRLLRHSSLRAIRDAAAARLFVLHADSKFLWWVSSWGRTLGRTLRLAFRWSSAIAESVHHLEAAGECVAIALRQQATTSPSSGGGCPSLGVPLREPWDIDGRRIDPTPWAPVNDAARRKLAAAAANPRASTHEGAVAALRRWGVPPP